MYTCAFLVDVLVETQAKPFLGATLVSSKVMAMVLDVERIRPDKPGSYVFRHWAHLRRSTVITCK